MKVFNTIGLALVVFCWAVGPSFSAQTRTTKPGQNKNFSWGRKDINICRKEGKPILLYIYDNKMGKKTNGTALSHENNLFPDKDVKAALSGYNYVMLSSSFARGWPKQLIAGAHGGAALYLMTCDGSAYGTWRGTQRPPKKQFALLAKQVKQANPAAKERMAKNPPKKYEDPPDPVARGGGEPQIEEPQEKKRKTAGMIPGLGEKEGEEGKGGKGDGAKKTPKSKRPVDIEEEE